MEMKTGSNNNHISASSSNNNNSSLLQQQQQRSSTSVTVSSSHIVTEWEDGIIFDVDDPDFCNLATDKLNFIATHRRIRWGGSSSSWTNYTYPGPGSRKPEPTFLALPVMDMVATRVSQLVDPEQCDLFVYIRKHAMAP
ncbi:protein pinocchio isoform X3 [Drosophila sechellia]|uniref:protein pinocchio isoform X3 n=1 Tax=Drosophila sechellia TaxID=7238 RepID=UPI0013DE72EE|nr:protein pinocchio isoform X3 [Drosophila sechellia]